MDNIILYLVFTFFGLIFSSIGIAFLYFTKKYLKNGIKTKGKVIQMLGGSPKVSYQVDGKSYTFLGSVSSNPPSYRVGDDINILYLPNQPEKAKIDDFTTIWLFPLVFGSFGLTFILAVFGMIFANIEDSNQQNLANSGIVIESKFNRVEKSGNEYKIITQYVDLNSKKEYFFESQVFYKNPKPCINREYINVKVLPNDYYIYEVDTSFISQNRKNGRCDE